MEFDSFSALTAKKIHVVLIKCVQPFALVNILQMKEGTCWSWKSSTIEKPAALQSLNCFPIICFS